MSSLQKTTFLFHRKNHCVGEKIYLFLRMDVADDASSFRASCLPNIGFLLWVGQTIQRL